MDIFIQIESSDIIWIYIWIYFIKNISGEKLLNIGNFIQLIYKKLLSVLDFSCMRYNFSNAENILTCIIDIK